MRVLRVATVLDAPLAEVSAATEGIASTARLAQTAAGVLVTLERRPGWAARRRTLRALQRDLVTLATRCR
ncbi:MAG: hypothetical protein FWD74_03535 [Actinomycetia bacterium]|nr:hypothetical protein [Actinomycetes bacterium]